MTLAEECLPDFDGKVAVFMVEVIPQYQNERFSRVEVLWFFTFGLNIDVVEAGGDRLDSFGVKSWCFLVKNVSSWVAK